MWSIIIGLAFGYAAYHLTYKFGDKNNKTSVVTGIAAGAVMAAMWNYLTPDLSLGICWVYIIVALAFICGVVYQFYKEGDELNEFVAAAVLIGLSGFVASTAATHIKWVFPLLLATVVPILAIGFCAISALLYNRKRAKDAKVKSKMSGLMALAAVVTLFVLLGGVKFAFSASEYGMLGKQQAAKATNTMADTVNAADNTDESKTTTKKDTSKVANWHFYNNDVQGGSEEDDFNFGPMPAVDTATAYDEDFRARLEKDPALGAADIAWADAWLGTRYLGEFYESCNEDWAKTINAAKEAWIKDPDAYKATLDAFFQYLNTAEVKVTAGNGLEDQMYMNPYTVDGTPDVIVLATPDHSGKFLTYLFTIKGTGKVKVMYRIECGYQPTNVEEVMGITPQQKPSNPSNPGKGDNPSNPGKGDNPTNPSKPSNPSNPSYNKDPNKAPKKNTEPNDDPGPGPNTNNPSNPSKSTEDTPDSSTSGSYQDYKDNLDNLKDTNNTQRSGGDSNKPSTPAPSPNTNVDNNGSKIDAPTPKQDAETVKGDPAAGTMTAPS